MTHRHWKQGLVLAGLLGMALLVAPCLQSQGILVTLRDCTPECIRSAPLADITFARGELRGEFPRGCRGSCERETSCANRALAQIEEPWTLQAIQGLLRNASQGKKAFAFDGPDATRCFERTRLCYNECKDLALGISERYNY